MNSNLNQQLRALLAGIDPKKRADAQRAAESFLQTPAGAELMEKLRSADPEKLASVLQKVDRNQLKNALRSATPGTLSAEQAENLLRKLR